MFPVASGVPSVAIAYQVTVPADGAASSVTASPLHTGVGCAMVNVGISLMVAITAVRGALQSSSKAEA